MNEEQKIQAERQKFQSNGRLFALKVHAVWTKVENVVLYIPRKLADYVSATDTFVQAGHAVDRQRAQLTVVK